MSQVQFRMTGASPAYASYAQDEETEEAMYRAMMRALRETGINVKLDLDGETVYEDMVMHNDRNTRTTGVNRMARV